MPIFNGLTLYGAEYAANWYLIYRTAIFFRGIVITGGVGVFNYIVQLQYKPRETVKESLYVGRFVEVKNLKLNPVD